MLLSKGHMLLVTFDIVLIDYDPPISLDRQCMFLDLCENDRCTNQVLAETWRLSSPHLADDILEPRVIQEQLSQYLFQNLHAISKVGEVR